MSRAVFGPYLGEFGWELCLWNPLARKIAQRYDDVAVIAPAGSRYLYEFARTFVPLDPEPGTSDFMEGKVDPAALVRAFTAAGEGDLHRPTPTMWQAELERFSKAAKGFASEKEWRAYALDFPEVPSPRFDACVAFRPPKLFNGKLYPDKAYPIELARDLVARMLASGLSVASVGGSDNFMIEGTTDLRGAPLGEQCRALSWAGVCVGPSSAPLHLAQLCGCPVVTWYNRPRAESRGRYEGWWNPFGVPSRFIDGADPAPEKVLAACRDILRSL